MRICFAFGQVGETQEKRLWELIVWEPPHLSRFVRSMKADFTSGILRVHPRRNEMLLPFREEVIGDSKEVGIGNGNAGLFHRIPDRTFFWRLPIFKITPGRGPGARRGRCGDAGEGHHCRAG